MKEKKKRQAPEGKTNIILCIKKDLLAILTNAAKAREESRNKFICTILEEKVEESLK